MTRDRNGQVILPGFLDAAARTRLETEGNLPGDLFRQAPGPAPQESGGFTFGGWINTGPAPASRPRQRETAKGRRLKRKAAAAGHVLGHAADVPRTSAQTSDNRENRAEQKTAGSQGVPLSDREGDRR